MRTYDSENKADDDRNNKMSDLACENDMLRKALVEIREIWAGSDGFIPQTCPEHYLQRLCLEMFRTAIKAIERSS